MAAESSTQGHDPTLVERLLDRQRDGWRRGEPVFVEALVAGHPALADDRDGLLDLICNEVDLRASRGETPRLDEYRGRFPTLSEDLSRQFEVFTALGSVDKIVFESSDGRAGATVKGEPPLSAGKPSDPLLQEGYEVLGELGRGAMGVVFKARQTALNRVVALKMILSGVYADREDLQRFRAEAEAVARLHHPNVVQIHHVGAQDGRPFLALEFVDGGGLDRRLAGTPLPAAAAAKLVETLARAIHHAHERGVVHRDLKPANVMLTEDGAPKITDFGLAKRMDVAGLSHSGDVVGTPSYMAPEQAAGKSSEIGPAVDVYALGAILYECLTGRPPFKAPTLLETLSQVKNDDPVPPRQLQSKTPRDLETVCLKCLRKDPKRRYTSAHALAEDLRRYQAGEPVTARPVSRLERTWRWSRRNPKDAVLIAAAALAVALGTFAYLWSADRQAKASKAAEGYLAKAELLWEQAKAAPVGDLSPWKDALNAADQAKAVVNQNAVDETTRRRVEQVLTAITEAKQEAETRKATSAKDERMNAELEKLAFSQLELKTGTGAGEFDSARGNNEYERVFRTYYDIDLSRPEEAETRIRASAIKPQLVAALDAWIPLRPDEQARRETADLADRLSEPDRFRGELRKALVELDGARVRELAKRDLSALPPHVLFSVALALSNSLAYEAAVELLRPAQQRYPEDFGVNYQLGYCLVQLDPPRTVEAIRFFTAATALRPNDSLAHHNLGVALANQGTPSEAVAEFRAAIQMDPQNAEAHTDLGATLRDQGKLDEAAAEFRAAIQCDPRFAVAHDNLGTVLGDQGKLDESVAEHQTAIQLDDKLPYAHYNLGTSLAAQGKLDEAVAAYRAALQKNNNLTAAHFNLGLALCWNGDFTGALIEFKKCQALSPPADALFSQAMDQGDQVVALLKAEYGLAAVLKGEAKPGSAVEAGNLALICLAKKQDAAAARLYAEMFADPSLSQDKTISRCQPAKAAALAGCGRGTDAAAFTDPERARWRNQACDWLRADLEALSLQAGSDKPQDRQFAVRQLRIWQCHVDFAGVRDEAELKKLPENEQALWRKFWTDVAALVDRAEKR